MTEEVYQKLIREFPEAINSGSELLFPFSQARRVLFRLQQLKIAVFRVEAFIVDDSSVTALLNSIFDVHGGDRKDFILFVDYSIERVLDYLDESEKRHPLSSQLYLCFLMDSSFN
jgi:hypothetical protein